MSNTNQTSIQSTGTSRTTSHTAGARRVSTETKHSLKTSELPIYILAVLGVLDFAPQEAWQFVTILTVGYLLSRGLAKSGSRDFYDDDADHSHNR